MFKKKFNLKDLLLVIGVIIILIGLDQLTKYIFSHNEKILTTGKLEFIPNFMYFTLVYNKGAAWGMLSGKTFLLALISLVSGVLLMVVTYFLLDFKKHKLLSISLLLVTGGTLGNFIDRAFYEKGVIDFIQFNFWPLKTFPTFNLADSFLTVGAFIMIIYVLFFLGKEEQGEKNA